MPRLSVIILTCNRLDKVRRGLERLLPQLAEDDEVLLIDTGSTDGTREHFAVWHHRCVRLIEWRGAGSWAEIRNFGVGQARGTLIAFLDDDCLPDADWVARGRVALLGDGSHAPSGGADALPGGADALPGGADAVGGIVRPLAIASFPEWWHPDMGWMVGLSVPGHMGPLAGRVYYPFTANLWARAAVLRAVPFQELGGSLQGEESGKYHAGREDSQWWLRLRREGYRTRFDPHLGVGHAIDPARLDLAYLRRRVTHDGAAWAVRSGTPLDRIPLAYQWWRELLAAAAAPWTEEGARLAHWHYHRLMQRRQWSALRALAAAAPGGAQGRGAGGALWLAGWLTMAGFHIGRDRAKTAIRGLLRPWLHPRPAGPPSAAGERIAIIAFGYLGDLVILQSVLRGLMQAHPRLEVYVLSPPAGRIVLRDVRRLNLTIVPREPDPGSRGGAEWLAQWLGRIDPDAIAAPYLHEPWGRMLIGVAHPPRPVIGFDHDQGLTRRRHLERLPIKVHKDLARHEAENLENMLRVAGLRCDRVPAMIEVPEATRRRIGGHPWLQTAAGAVAAGAVAAGEEAAGRAPIVMLNPDAGHPQKEWTDAAWAALTDMILERTGWRVVVNASRPRPNFLGGRARQASRVFWLAQAPLEDLLGWLAESAALVTVDAGPQHLAHALGVPSVTLYGPMDERRWRDRFDRPIHRTLRACACDLTPEEKRGLAVNHEVALIAPEAVFEQLASLLSAG